MDKKSRNTIIISIVALVIVLITVTYAYFSARITGIESASTISLTAGHMEIVYTEGNEDIVLAQNIYPREEAWATKTFTLTGTNTTGLPMDYEMGLQIISNTFKGGELTYSLEVGQSNEGTSMSPVTNKSITKTSGIQQIGEGSFGTGSNAVQTYTLKIYFKDTGKDQNINQGAVFNAKIVATENGAIIPENNYTYAGTVQNGTSIENNQYEYRYNQEGCLYNECLISANNNKPQIKLLDNSWSVDNGWQSTNTNGWGVRLKDTSSTTPATEKLYTSINNIPITSMAYMFYGSQATSIDLSSFDTSNVTNMFRMFMSNQATTLDLSSFDTSNVTNMQQMFCNSQATSINLSSFDTSKVTNMARMFDGSYATSLDLSSFDTSNVTYMQQMFSASQAATTLDLSSFDVSGVQYMDGIFYESSIKTVYVRSESDAKKFCNYNDLVNIYVGNRLMCTGNQVFINGEQLQDIISINIEPTEEFYNNVYYVNGISIGVNNNVDEFYIPISAYRDGDMENLLLDRAEIENISRSDYPNLEEITFTINPSAENHITSQKNFTIEVGFNGSKYFVQRVRGINYQELLQLLGGDDINYRFPPSSSVSGIGDD